MKQAGVAALVLLFGLAAGSARAAPGDVYVPAHRTANGLWVPANVPTSSGGTRMAPKLRATKPAATNPVAAKPSSTHPATVPPLFVAAEPIRR